MSGRADRGRLPRGRPAPVVKLRATSSRRCSGLMRDGQPVTDGLWWLLWLPVLAISTPAALLLFAMSLELLERRLLGNDIAQGGIDTSKTASATLEHARSSNAPLWLPEPGSPGWIAVEPGDPNDVDDRGGGPTGRMHVWGAMR